MTPLATQPTTVILAGHSMLLALPAFVPAVLLVGVIVVIAVRDRRRGDDDIDDDENDTHARAVENDEAAG